MRLEKLMKIEILFPEFCNLFGDMYNMKSKKCEVGEINENRNFVSGVLQSFWGYV